MNKQILTLAAMAALAMPVLTACSDDDDNNSTGNNTPQVVDESKLQFIVASGDATDNGANDMTGGVTMGIFSDLTKAQTGMLVYDGNGTHSADGFSQYIYNPATGVYNGVIYARMASTDTEAGGLGVQKPAIRTFKVNNGKLEQVAEPVMLNNFGNTGYFGNYTYAAEISEPNVVRLNANGAATKFELDLDKLDINKTEPGIGVTNIIDRGNNQLALVLNYTDRDSAFVAFADYDFNIQSVITTGEIGASLGANRSVRYSMSGADDEGNIYVFSGNSATDSKVGVVRIKKGETSFDASYKFNILSAAANTDGLRFRKVFHISGSKFLLEFYLEKDAYEVMSASGKQAIVDVETKTLTWVTGLPDVTKVSFGWGDGLNGTYYLPVAIGTSMQGGGSGNSGGGRPATRAESSAVTPTVYAIDANTGVATPRFVFSSGDLLKSIRIMK